MRIWAVLDTEPLLKNRTGTCNLASRPKQRAAQRGALFNQQHARATECGKECARNPGGTTTNDDDIVVIGWLGMTVGGAP